MELLETKFRSGMQNEEVGSQRRQVRVSIQWENAIHVYCRLAIVCENILIARPKQYITIIQA